MTATALQGELPGLFVRATRPLVVAGRDDRPFLTYDGTAWQVDPTSPSWVDDERAKGRAVSTGAPRTTQVARGPSYSWLDRRLRYPHDLPPESDLATTTVVQHWRVPVTVGGVANAIEGTVTWQPRAVRAPRGPGHRQLWVLLGAALVVLAVSATWLWRRPRGVRA